MSSAFQQTGNFQNNVGSGDNTAVFFWGSSPPTPSLSIVQVGWYAQGSGFSNVPITAIVHSNNNNDGGSVTVASPNVFSQGSFYYFTSAPIVQSTSNGTTSSISVTGDITGIQVGWLMQGVSGDVVNAVVTNVDSSMYNVITTAQTVTYTNGNYYYFTQKPNSVQVTSVLNDGLLGIFDVASISYATTNWYAQGVDVANIQIGIDPAYPSSVGLLYGNPYVQYGSYYFTQTPLAVTATSTGNTVVVSGDISYFQVGWYVQSVSSNSTIDVFNAPIDSINFETQEISILTSGQSFTDTYQYYVTSSPIPVTVNDTAHAGTFTTPSYTAVNYVQAGWYAQGITRDLIDVPVTSVNSDNSTQITTITLDSNYSGFTSGNQYWFTPVPLSALTLIYNFWAGFVFDKLPIENGTIAKIYWGDGTVSTSFSSHTYTDAGTYIVKVQGKNITHLTQVDNSQPTGLNKAVELLMDCTSFGEIGFTDFTNAFLGAKYLVNIPSSLPFQTAVTNMSCMFRDSTGFNQNLNNWVFTSVTNMYQMFYNATSFNNGDSGNTSGNSTNWDVANVTNMSYMFYNATSFNKDVSDWDVSNVIDMSNMFDGATLFNNGDTGDNIAHPINWSTKIANIENIDYMFQGAVLFNQVTNFSFGSNISSTITGIFYDATSFNQDISNWNIKHTAAIDIFKNNSSFVTTKYNSMLQTWRNALYSGSNTIRTGITFVATGLIYSDTYDSYRSVLINTYGWTIYGDIYSSREIAHVDSAFSVTVPYDTYSFTVGDKYKLFLNYNGTYYPISSALTYSTSTNLVFNVVLISSSIVINPYLRAAMVLRNTDTTTDVNTYYLDFIGVPCFKEDSRILCLVDGAEVYVPVQDIRIGDIVKTYLHGYKKVTVIGNGIIYNNGSDPARIKERLYKYTVEEYPDLTEDLVLTGGHSILVNELTEEQKKVSLTYRKQLKKTDDKYLLLAVVDEKTLPYEKEGIFTIFHITLEHEDDLANYGIFANGLLVESCPKTHLLNKKYMTITE